MKEETFVTHQIAELLKQAGFPQRSTRVIYVGDTICLRKPWHVLFGWAGSPIIDAPSIAMAMKYLREAHECPISVCYTGKDEENNEWWESYWVAHGSGSDVGRVVVGPCTYEIAALKTIEQVCEYLIHKDEKPEA